MLARLTKFGISSVATPSQLRSAREHFEQHNYLRLPGFIEPGLLRVIQHYLVPGDFEKKEHDVGRELRLSNSPVASVFHILMNDPKLFRLIRKVTGCGPLGCVSGRVYQMVARQGQAFDWHNDTQEDRKIAISINLSDAPYRGGTLEIREGSRGAGESVPNLGFGDAIIFRVARRLEHRVTPVAGRVSKTAYSGWFRSRPKYISMRREMVAQSESAIAAGAIRRHKSFASPSPNDVVKIPSVVVCQTAGSGTFVANIGTSMCYGLNGTGSRIWELMAEGHPMRSISSTIAREYGAPRREVERDVMALANQLAQRDLIKFIHNATRRRVRAIGG